MGEMEVVGGSGKENGMRRWREKVDNMEDEFEGVDREEDNIDVYWLPQ